MFSVLGPGHSFCSLPLLPNLEVQAFSSLPERKEISSARAESNQVSAEYKIILTALAESGKKMFLRACCDLEAKLATNVQHGKAQFYLFFIAHVQLLRLRPIRSFWTSRVFFLLIPNLAWRGDGSPLTNEGACSILGRRRGGGGGRVWGRPCLRFYPFILLRIYTCMYFCRDLDMPATTPNIMNHHSQETFRKYFTLTL